VIAWQVGSDQVMWEHRDPSNSSFRTTFANGIVNTSSVEGGPAELDATKGNAGLFDWSQSVPPEGGSLLPYPSFSSPQHPGLKYTRDGVPIPLDEFIAQLDYAFHGPFGLLDAAAKASQPKRNYQVNTPDGPAHFGDEKAARDFARKYNLTVVISSQDDNTWANFAKLLPRGPLSSEETTKAQQGINGARSLVKADCASFLQKLINRAASQVRWGIGYVSLDGSYDGGSFDGSYPGINALGALQSYQDQLKSGNILKGGSGVDGDSTTWATTNSGYQVILNREFFTVHNNAHMTPCTKPCIKYQDSLMPSSRTPRHGFNQEARILGRAMQTMPKASEEPRKTSTTF
jgi:hypothetical protein